MTRSFLCKRVLQVCASHLAVENEAQKHYKAVCRALVSEALELSNFMEKVKKHETESDCKELQELGLQDWARLWRQILKDMRDGVKLKKVDYTKTPVEYELTPYEVLMEDIRNKRFSLNKIMVDGELPPRMKKDAHDIILQFIRHRPPLKPVSNYLSYGMSQQVLDENSFFFQACQKIRQKCKQTFTNFPSFAKFLAKTCWDTLYLNFRAKISLKRREFKWIHFLPPSSLSR